MELKKNPKADLNLQRTLFFQIGLCVALAGTLYAFNWREGDNEAASLGTLQMEDLTEMEIPQTEQKVTPPPPPPPPTLEVVADEEVIEEDESRTDTGIIDEFRDFIENISPEDFDT